VGLSAPNRVGRLRPSRQRPRRRAPEPRDEFAPRYSITSSAVANRLGGIVSPSAFAVLRLFGLRLSLFSASTDRELLTAFQSMAQQQVSALIVSTDASFLAIRDQIVALAAHRAIPAIYAARDFAFAGGLISYGVEVDSLHRQAGIYTGRILKGDKPGDLPVQQPTKFQLVINLKTAKALGLTVPLALQAAADEVIE
jgi:putative tryptophan/tyrosine transport system substrate-binding protein